MDTTQTTTANLDTALEHATPSPAIAALDRLVGEWTIADGATGVVRYEWMPGRHFLIQHVELEQSGEPITGIEIIGHLRPLGGTRSDHIASRFYDSSGNTFDYTYELDGDTLTIWEGEKGSDSHYRGTFSADDQELTGAWTYPDGGGYATTTRRR